MTHLYIPKSTGKLVNDQLQKKDCNHSLALDKFVSIGKGTQEEQKKTLDKVAELNGDSTNELASWLARRKETLNTQKATVWECETVGPMTLWLSRASALENAGICLHPVYGFVYLPGSGLKGMARAYAETVWLPSEKEAETACGLIERVFGNRPGEKKQEKQKAGSIVFHDAWPIKWPKLVVDIVNNHHPKYYQGDDAPGDWENPNPVYFLAIGAGERFSFALSQRRDGMEDGARLLELAREWLTGALCHMGAGAKTNAGYGSLKPVDTASVPVSSIENSPAIKIFSATLSLVTPAFLAGAGQQAEDCDLRPATLRGILRWWWRTMHAGHMDVDTLRRLEAEIWGDTNTGGTVRVEVSTIEKSEERYQKDGKRGSDFEKPRDRKTTQGLFYTSFGMDTATRPRHFANHGSNWKITLTSKNRDSRKSDLFLEEAKAALWLICRYGGVGSKSRKGFGSFGMPDELKDMEEKCKTASQKIGESCGIGGTGKTGLYSPALNNMLGPVEIVTDWKNPWAALDQVGFSYQSFAQAHKHQNEKKALGLPRRIGAPVRGNFSPEKTTERHTSPVHVHLEKRNDGALTIRVVAFPSKYLPNMETSRTFLQEFMDHLKKDLTDRAGKYKGKWQNAPVPQNRTDRKMPSRLPNSGERVKAKLLDEKTKKGGWKAMHIDTGISGHIVNTEKVPASAKSGDEMELLVSSSSPREIAFRYPE